MFGANPTTTADRMRSVGVARRVADQGSCAYPWSVDTAAIAPIAVFVDTKLHTSRLKEASQQ